MYNKKYQKEYRLKHKVYFNKYNKKYYKKNKLKILKDKRKYSKNNKLQIAKYQQKYRIKNLSRIRKTKSKCTKLRYKKDSYFKIKRILRARLNCAIKNNQKKGSAVKDLGCSISEFKQYIESKFYSNMTWDNWGTIWELDHIKRLADFDLTDREQFLKACHYTNLQPLTIEDHKNKSNDKEQAK